MMMSNPPSALQQRQRLHRRQNSTPVAFEALKVPNLPPTTQRPQSHRRGQSLDQRSPSRLQQHQAESLVGITNTGSIQSGQQILREAQQQRIIRPGQHHMTISASPSCGPYTSGPGTQYDTTTMHAIMSQGNMQMMQQQYFNQEMNMPMSAGLEGMGLTLDENNQHYFQNLQGMNMNMMEERRMSQPDLRIQTGRRPYTPEQQIHSAHFPLTPAATPFHHQYARSLQSSPIRQSAEAHIQSPRPISMQRGRSLQGIVENEQQICFETPPSSAPIMQSENFDFAEMPVPERYINRESNESRSPQRTEQASVHSSPMPTTPPARLEDVSEETLPFFDETGGEAIQLDDHPIPLLPSSSAPAGSMSPTRPALSPRRISITDLHLEPGISASIEETNITLDDIAQFIEGPSANNNKWICIYEDCGKKFGRKENIKSHVQTHLGDRQFRCDHCKKCFVRGHDLKRHAKIHTGTKPYPCLCGNSFARHDALTRHRQRGMCIGAFDGIVKKDVKRGRPKKHRPEMDDRMDKAARTRRKMNELQGLNEMNDQSSQYDYYASSASSDSMSSWGSPPTETMENLSIRGGSPFDDMALFGVAAGNHHPMGQGMDNVGLPPNMFSFTPPTSPGFSTGQKPSPHHSHRSITPTEMADLPELPTMPIHHLTSMAMQHSHQSLPSLSHSSSSPAADVVAFDFSEDPTASQVHRMVEKGDENADRGVGINDFDRFLDYGMGIEGDSFFAGL